MLSSAVQLRWCCNELFCSSRCSITDPKAIDLNRILLLHRWCICVHRQQWIRHKSFVFAACRIAPQAPGACCIERIAGASLRIRPSVAQAPSRMTAGPVSLRRSKTPARHARATAHTPHTPPSQLWHLSRFSTRRNAFAQWVGVSGASAVVQNSVITQSAIRQRMVCCSAATAITARIKLKANAAASAWRA